jgi:glycosyltransferase involved in cell wall biosynthesis
MTGPKISVITVTLNCAEYLPRLVSSLLAQDDQDFDWIVVDGGSVDSTLEIVARFPRTCLSSGPDFGIYDALNKGIRMAQCDYYLVVGADDELYPTAIANFRKSVGESHRDIVAASVDTNRATLHPMRGRKWLRGGNAFVASHAVGTLIRRQLHEEYGYYSNRYVNCADMHFILSVLTHQSAQFHVGSFTAGRFSDAGISTTDRITSISDAFRIQLAFGESKALQLGLYLVRLIRALFFR